MKKIIFIDPPGRQLGLHTGLGYLAGQMDKEGISVKVIDFNNYRYHARERLNKIGDADFVGLTVKTALVPETLRLIKVIKDINPRAAIVTGGVHLMMDGMRFMEDNPLIDIGVIGEGEKVLPRIIKGEPFSEIPGIIFRQNGIIKKSEKENRPLEMDKLPFPSYRAFDSCGGRRRDYFPLGFYPLVTSKGCPYQCVFCVVPTITGKRWRARSPEKLTLELKKVKEETGIEEFAICDDNFTTDLARAKRFCQLLIEERVGMKWSCPNGIKGDHLDRELAHLMRQSGCYAVNIGIETGNEKIFKLIKKGGTLKNIEEAIKILKEEDMIVVGFFVVGLPGTDIKVDKASFNYSRSLPLDFSFWSVSTPYPDTELYDMIRGGEFGARMLRDWRDGARDGVNPQAVFETDEYKAGDRIRMYNWANLRNRLYGSLTDRNSSTLKKIIDIMWAIIKYDLWRLPHHTFNIVITLARGLRGKSSMAMLPSYYRMQKR